MRTVTKAQAAAILHISPNEVVRQIERGELKGRKKTDSKYSDWLVELPDEQEEAKEVEEVKEVLETPEPIEKEETHVEETEPDQVVEEPEQVVEEPVGVVEPKLCSRCEKPIESDAPEGVNICGTCADELRQEEEAVKAAEQHEKERTIEEPEPIVVVKEEPVKSIPKQKEETDVRSKKGDENLRWWYGNQG